MNENDSNLWLIKSFQPAEGEPTSGELSFGGQPVWVDIPHWPISSTTKRKMQFICQVPIDKEQFPKTSARMAYLFMAEDEDCDGETWDPLAGDNAVILQPGSVPSHVDCVAEAVGPTVVQVPWQVEANGKARRWICELEPKTHTELIEEFYRPEMDEDDEEPMFYGALEGSKIGGKASWVQGEEFDEKNDWRLLLQLDAGDVPFFLNFGDAGVGYLFISRGGSEGRFRWQCF